MGLCAIYDDDIGYFIFDYLIPHMFPLAQTTYKHYKIPDIFCKCTLMTFKP